MTDFKDSTGKVIGELINTEMVGLDPNRYEISHVKLFSGIGEWTFSQYDIVDYERIKAIAEYKKILVEGEIQELQDEIKEREEMVEKLKGRLEAIGHALNYVDTKIEKGE